MRTCHRSHRRESPCPPSKQSTPGRSWTRAATPPLEVEVELDDGTLGRAAVPSGASTGAFEAVELRDGGDEYGGKAVGQGRPGRDRRDPARAARLRRRRSAADRPGPDRPRPDAGQVAARRERASSASAWRWPGRPPSRPRLPLFRYLGGPNAHVLPVPQMNILNGGAHADNNVDVQEFMILPVGGGHVRRGAALGRGDLPRAEVRAQAARPGHRRR